MRTPLTGVIGFLGLLKDSGGLTLEQEELTRMATACGQQLLSQINDVLDLSKLEENRVTLESSVFSLRELIEDALEVMWCQAEKKGLELSYFVKSLDLHRALIRADPNRLKQIFTNLLCNAVKFSNKGEIVVSAWTETMNDDDPPASTSVSSSSSRSVEIHFSVEDEGIGIPEEARGKLFTPFSQADDSTSRRFVSTLFCGQSS